MKDELSIKTNKSELKKQLKRDTKNLNKVNEYLFTVDNNSSHRNMDQYYQKMIDFLELDIACLFEEEGQIDISFNLKEYFTTQLAKKKSVLKKDRQKLLYDLSVSKSLNILLKPNHIGSGFFRILIRNDSSKSEEDIIKDFHNTLIYSNENLNYNVTRESSRNTRHNY